MDVPPPDDTLGTTQEIQPQPGPALDTLVALSNDVCKGSTGRTLSVGHRLFRPTELPNQPTGPPANAVTDHARKVSTAPRSTGICHS
jgi:hypothetical protein